MRVRIAGSEWTKTEAEDEAEAAAVTTEARVQCTTRCARTAAKPPRSRSNRTRPDPSTAEIVSQSAGRDGSKSITAAFEPFSFELPTRRAAGAELVFPYPDLSRRSPQGQGPRGDVPRRSWTASLDRAGRSRSHRRPRQVLDGGQGRRMGLST